MSATAEQIFEVAVTLNVIGLCLSYSLGVVISSGSFSDPPGDKTLVDGFIWGIKPGGRLLTVISYLSFTVPVFVTCTVKRALCPGWMQSFLGSIVTETSRLKDCFGTFIIVILVVGEVTIIVNSEGFTVVLVIFSGTGME